MGERVNGVPGDEMLHGDFFVMEAAQRARGYEFRPR